MIKNKYPRFLELEREVNKIFLDHRREPDKAKQLATVAVQKFAAEFPDTPIDDMIDHLEDDAQESQDFSVFGIVEILREYR